jgi:glycosyltransferase involved in cell wall biosynthesis
VTVHTLRSTAPAVSCLATHQLGRPLVHASRIRRILASGFDVIHFHNASLVGGPQIFSYGTGVKLCTAHEHWLVCPTHILWRHDRELCTGRECVRCSIAHRRPPQLWRGSGLLERHAQHIDAFIALSQFSADKHAEFGFCRPMTVMPSFLPDLPARRPSSPASTPATRPYFLFVGRLERVKGLQDIIPLFDESMPADLLIAGSGSYEAALRELAADRPTIQFLGWCDPEQLALLYRSALAVVAPSKCYEVFPLVTLEAFQQGVPIIARRLGSYPEIVARTRGGILFDDAEQFGAAARTLACDRPLRDQMARAARAAFQATWSEAVALDAYFDLIRSIAARRGLDDITGAFTVAERSYSNG